MLLNAATMEVRPEIQPARPDARGVEILARSLFRQMRHQGFSREQIITLSTELLQLVHEDLAQSLPAQ